MKLYHLILVGLVSSGLMLGCNDSPIADDPGETPGPGSSEQPIIENTAPRGETKRKEIGPNVFVETEGDLRRVIVKSSVCLKAGYLEHFLTTKEAGKNHESVLMADIDARHLHTALIVTGAKPGKPAEFYEEDGEYKFRPARGDKIKVEVRYQKDGRTVGHSARKWVRSVKTKNELKNDWVFAGSRFYPDPSGKEEPFYGANEGRVICVTNFDTALMDLPILSMDGDPQEGLDYEANSDLIPALETPVEVILELANDTEPKK